MPKDLREEASFQSHPAGETRGRMDDLVDFLQAAPAEAPELFSASLDLLVRRLDMDLALMTKETDLGCEAFWWSTRPGFPAESFIQDPATPFWDRMMEGTLRGLVVRDAHADPLWSANPQVRARGIRSYLGAPLWEEGRIVGVVSVQGAAPRDFTREEVALVAAVAKLVSRTLEIEHLKSQLQLTRDALELSSAVLEDSSLHSPASGLPNLRYLEVWLKANLSLARRNRETLPLMLLRLEGASARPDVLVRMGGTLRGVDLLVDQGDGTFLLLLPGTPVPGVSQLLERLRALSPHSFPAAATVWDPLEDDLLLRSALRRLREALAWSRGQEDHLVWRLDPSTPM